MSANPHRATVVIALGAPPVEHDVCLNLAALAEIEAELKVEAPELLARGYIGVTKALVILHAGLKGAGKKIDRAAVASMLDPMRPGDIMAAAVTALKAAFLDPEPSENPPQAASPSAASPGSA